MWLFGSKKKTTSNASGNDSSELTRVCEKCGKELPLKAFAHKKIRLIKTRAQSWCNDCRMEYEKEVFMVVHGRS